MMIMSKIFLLNCLNLTQSAIYRAQAELVNVLQHIFNGKLQTDSEDGQRNSTVHINETHTTFTSQLNKCRCGS